MAACRGPARPTLLGPGSPQRVSSEQPAQSHTKLHVASRGALQSLGTPVQPRGPAADRETAGWLEAGWPPSPRETCDGASGQEVRWGEGWVLPPGAPSRAQAESIWPGRGRLRGGMGAQGQGPPVGAAAEEGAGAVARRRPRPLLSLRVSRSGGLGSCLGTYGHWGQRKQNSHPFLDNLACPLSHQLHPGPCTPPPYRPSTYARLCFSSRSQQLTHKQDQDRQEAAGQRHGRASGNRRCAPWATCGPFARLSARGPTDRLYRLQWGLGPFCTCCPSEGPTPCWGRMNIRL